MLSNENNYMISIVGVERLKHKGGFFKVAPRNYSALAFRISGNSVINCNGKEYNVNPTELVYIPQKLAYTAEYNDTEMIFIHFITAIDDKSTQVYHLHSTEKVFNLFLKAKSLWERKEPGYKLYVQSVFYEILGTIAENKSKSLLPPHFLKAVAIINAQYKNCTLCIEEICKKTGLSATNLRLLFKQYYGKTPLQYITDLRLEHARMMIANGATVESASYNSGFNDPKYFARVVKKRFGCTPRDLKLFGK